MQTAISISEILGTIHDGSVEVCASADAEYDPIMERVSVSLDAFARRAIPGGEDVPQTWMPAPEWVSEHLPRDEADEFVKDVFHSWVKRVRASIPQNLQLRM